MCAQSAGVRCLCKKEAHVGVYQACMRVCVRVCRSVCVEAGACLCVRASNAIACQSPDNSKQARRDRDTATWPSLGRLGSAPTRLPPLPLPLLLPSLSLTSCAAGHLWRLSTLPTACQPTLLCFRMSCTHTSLSFSLTLSLSHSASLCVYVCACCMLSGVDFHNCQTLVF